LRRLALLVGELKAQLEDLEQIGGTIARLVEPSQRVERRQIFGPLVEDRVIPRDRLARVAKLALLQLRDAPHEIAPRLVGRVDQLEPPLQDVGQLRPLPLRLVQLLERVERAQIARILVEHLAIGPNRRRRIDEQLLFDPPDAEQELLLLLELVGPLRLPVQDVDELTPALGRFVQPRQRRRRRPRRVQVRRIELEQPLPGRARLVDVAELVLVQLGRALEELAAQRQVRRLGGEERLFPRRRQLRLPPEEVRQSLDVDADLLVRRIDAQRFAPRGQRQLPRAQPLLLQLGQLRGERRRLVPAVPDLGRLALRTEHQRQLRPRLVLAIERLERLGDALAQLGTLHERLEPLARALVLALDGQRLLEQIGGALRIVEPVGVQIAAPVGQVRARLRRARRLAPRRRKGNAPRDQLVERAPIFAARVEPLERAERPLRAGIDLEDLDVILGRRVVLVEHALVEIRDLIEQRQPRLGIERARFFALEERAQIGPALVDAVELHERDLRVLVRLVALKHALVRALGVVGHAEPRVEELPELPGQLARQLGLAALVGRRLGVRQLHRPVVGLVELIGEHRHHAAVLGVRRRAPEHLAAVPVRTRGVAELRRRQIHEPPEEAELDGLILFGAAHDLQRVDELFGRVVLAHRQALLVDRHEQARHRDAIVGLGLGLEPALERRHRRLVRRRQRERVAIVRERAIGLAQVELIDLAEPLRQLEARVLVAAVGERQLPLEHVGHTARVATRRVQLLERAQGPRLRRWRLVRVEDPPVRRRRRDRIAELLLLDPGDLEEELEPPRGIAGARLSPLVDLEELPVVPRLRVDLLEVLQRLGILGRALQVLLEELARLVGLVQAPERDLRQLAVALDLLGVVGLLLDLGLIDLGQLFPRLGLGGEPLEVLLQRRVFRFAALCAPGCARWAERPQLIGLRRPGERQRLRAELLLAQLDDLAVQRDRLVVVAPLLRAEDDLVGRQEARPLLARAIDRNERVRRRHVLGVDRQDALVGLGRALGRLQLVLRDLGDAHVEADLLRRLGHALGDRRQDLAQLLVLPLAAIERLELGVAPRRRVQLAQRAHRLAVRGHQAHDLLVRLHRLRRILQLLREERAHLLEQHDLRLQVGALLVRLPLQNLDERRPAPIALVEPGEHRQRLDVVGRVLEHAVPDGDRLARVAEPIGGELGHLAEPRALLLRLAEPLELLALEIEQRPPRPPLAVDVAQFPDGVGIGRIDRVQLLERLDRLVVVRELVDPQPGDALEEARLVFRIRRHVDGALQDADEIVPPAHRLVLRRQRRQRIRVIRLELEDVVVRVDDHDVEVQLVAVDRDHLAELGHAPVDVVLGQRLDRFLQELEQRVPLLGLLVEALERRHRLGLRRILLEHALPQVDRLLRRARRALGEHRHLDAEIGAPLGVRLDLLRLPEHREQLAAVAVEERAIELEHRRMRRLGLAHLLPVLVGGLEVAELLPPQHADLQVHRRLGLAARPRAQG